MQFMHFVWEMQPEGKTFYFLTFEWSVFLRCEMTAHNACRPEHDGPSLDSFHCMNSVGTQLSQLHEHVKKDKE